MKITLAASALNTAAAWAARLTPNSPVNPVTAGVLIDVADQLTLSATDTDVFGTVTVPASIGEPGRLIVSARLLAAVTRTMPGGAEVTLESGGKGLLFRCQRFKGSLPAMKDEDWPPFPDPGDPIGEISGATLARCLDRVLPAVAAPNAPKVQLTGVLADFTDTPTLIGCDGPRMAAAELDWQPALDSADLEQLIIPADLLRNAADATNGGTVTIRSDGFTIGLATAHHRVIGRLIAGPYPAQGWRDLMDGPQQYCATSVTVDTNALRQAADQTASVVTPDPKVPTLIRLVIGPDEISVSLASKDASGDTGVELYSITGEPITIGAAHVYTIDALRCLGSPMTTITLTDDPLKSVLLRPADDKGDPIEDGYRHLLMPRSL